MCVGGLPEQTYTANGEPFAGARGLGLADAADSGLSREVHRPQAICRGEVAAVLCAMCWVAHGFCSLR